MKKFKFFVVVIVLVLLSSQVVVYANVQQPMPVWERFNHSYHFTASGFELGRPTTFEGFIPIDIFSANVRVDAQVALRPPSYGIFSGVIPTPPFNPLMPQPSNPNFDGGFTTLGEINTVPHFDTLQMGVNMQIPENPMNIHNFGTGEFLPPTSIR